MYVFVMFCFKNVQNTYFTDFLSTKIGKKYPPPKKKRGLHILQNTGW